jgi:hypothetical protein
MSIRNKILSLLPVIAISCVSQSAWSASGEMGRGVPNFGIYSAATGERMVVFSLSNLTFAFPAGCTALILTPTTMGLDSYKIAAATLTAAKISGTRVRFYAHGERDGGCGVDYVQLED